MTDKRQKVTKFKCNRDESITKQSVLLEYILLSSFAGARSQRITKLYHNRPGET